MALGCLGTATFPTSPGADSRGWPPGSANSGWVQGVGGSVVHSPGRGGRVWGIAFLSLTSLIRGQ